MTSIMSRLRSDWLWLLAALVLVGLISGITATRSGASAEQPLSVTSAAPNGGLALYLWLARSGYHLDDRTNNRPLTAGLEAGRDTLLMLTPAANVTSRTAGPVMTWVQAGGRLVLSGAAAATSRLVAPLFLGIVPASSGNIRVVQPLLVAPSVANLHGSASDVVTGAGGVSAPAGDPPAAVVASMSSAAVLVERRLGKGSVWLLTATNLLDNAHIGHADNRRLALDLVGAPGAHVVFDQFHASAPPPAAGKRDWLTGTVWGIVTLATLLILLLYRWLTGWRLGPALIPWQGRYRPASEYVVSMAGLLRRGHKRAEILAAYQRTLRRVIARRHGRDDVRHLDASTQSQLERLMTPAERLTEEQLVGRAGDIVECEERLGRTGA